MTDKPLDLATMTADEIFEVLQLTDMSPAERAEFLAVMAAWSRAVIPGPNLWWRKAVLTAVQWKRWHRDVVEGLISDALGSE